MQDHRLKPGIIVEKTSTNIGSHGSDSIFSKQVSSHDTLKRRYENAKAKNEILKIWFKTSSEEIMSVENETTLSINKSFWSPSGVWEGPSKIRGWAGGAKVQLLDDGNGQDQTSNSKEFLPKRNKSVLCFKIL